MFRADDGSSMPAQQQAKKKRKKLRITSDALSKQKTLFDDAGHALDPLDALGKGLQVCACIAP
jgi:hypothetical protein